MSGAREENRELPSPRQKEEASAPLWADFDASWYRQRYVYLLKKNPHLDGPDDAALEARWNEEGIRQELSPNRYVDESWYLASNPVVLQSVRHGGIFSSGFQHYCEIGFRTCSPHWLFSEEDYFRLNRDLSLQAVIREGYSNGYDHYLKVGDRERRVSHPFFDPDVFLSESLKNAAEYDFTQGGFSQFLRDRPTGMVRCSWYFDPNWYLARYPDIKTQIEQGQYLNPLHHYLTNDAPASFDPNPYFSEEYYTASHPDVRQAIAQGVFRNGYDHFIQSGVHEKRRPSAEVDLAAFAQQPDIAERIRYGVAPDLFALWAMLRERGGVPFVQEDASADQYRRLYYRRAETLLPAMLRAPLDFRLTVAPSLSVVLLAGKDRLALMATLAALHENMRGDLQVIAVDPGFTENAIRIERIAHGVTLVQPEKRLTKLEQFALGAKMAKAEIVLLLEAGVQPLYGALRAVRDLFHDKKIWGCGGQILSLDDRVQEAGSIVWRDGSVQPRGRGLSPHAPGIAYRCDVDAVSDGAIFCRRDKLEKIFSLLDASSLEAGYIQLSLAMRREGGRLLYEPSVLMRDPGGTRTKTATERERAEIRLRFRDFLSRQPLNGVRPPRMERGPAILLLYDRLPRRVEGGASERAHALLMALTQLGYRITLLGMEAGQEDRLTAPMDYPETVETIAGCPDFASFLSENSGRFDAFWIGGTQVFERIAPVLKEKAASLPARGIVLDTATLQDGGLRAVEAYKRRLVGAQDDREKLLAESAAELSDAWLCQSIVAVDEEEAAIIRQLGYPGGRSLGYAVEDVPGTVPGFAQRQGLLFSLPVHRPGDASHDAFDWFSLHVSEQLERFLPEDVAVTIGGYCSPEVDLGFYGHFVRLERQKEGQSYEDMLRSHRLMIAPTRVFGGQSYEVLQAAAHGLPCIVGEGLMHQLGWQGALDVLNGGMNDPEHFARTVGELYLDEALWNKASAQLRRDVRKKSSAEVFLKTVASILDESFKEITSSPAKRTASPSRPTRLEPAPLNLRPMSGASDVGAKPIEGEMEGPACKGRNAAEAAKELKPWLGMSRK